MDKRAAALNTDLCDYVYEWHWQTGFSLTSIMTFRSTFCSSKPVKFLDLMKWLSDLTKAVRRQTPEGQQGLLKIHQVCCVSGVCSTLTVSPWVTWRGAHSNPELSQTSWRLWSACPGKIKQLPGAVPPTAASATVLNKHRCPYRFGCGLSGFLYVLYSNPVRAQKCVPRWYFIAF